MDIEALITARLKTVTPNVYVNVAPLKYLTPCCAYQLIETETLRDLSDDEQNEGWVTLQFAISSPIYSQAKTLARSIRNSLKAWEHEDISAAVWIDEVAGVDNSTDTALHRILLFFKFDVSEL